MKRYLSLIKFSHTVFALPFALVGLMMGMHDAPGGFSGRILVLVLLCMVFGRSAAMAFNRYIDRDIDARNPRTASREIPAGLIAPKAALFFILFNTTGFLLSAWLINPLCFYLAPLALLVILGYSYTKRFTWLCHFVLGLGLGLAPVGAYIAVTGHFALLPVLLGLSVLTWVSGFDIIYASQDIDFDRSMQLHSVPARFGVRRALQISTWDHIICALLLLLTGGLALQHYPELNLLTALALLFFIAMLVFQHRLVSHQDLSRVNLAFMTTNGIASVIFGSLLILDFIY